MASHIWSRDLEGLRRQIEPTRNRNTIRRPGNKKRPNPPTGNRKRPDITSKGTAAPTRLPCAKSPRKSKRNDARRASLKLSSIGLRLINVAASTRLSWHHNAAKTTSCDYARWSSIPNRIQTLSAVNASREAELMMSSNPSSENCHNSYKRTSTTIRFHPMISDLPARNQYCQPAESCSHREWS